MLTRRSTLAGLAASALLPAGTEAAGLDQVPTDFRAPYRYGKLVLEKSPAAGDFDSVFVDGPFVFRGPDRFYMTYYGFDGMGYQTGLAESDVGRPTLAGGQPTSLSTMPPMMASSRPPDCRIPTHVACPDRSRSRPR